MQYVANMLSCGSIYLSDAISDDFTDDQLKVVNASSYIIANNL